MANPTARRPLFSRARRQVIAFLQRQKVTAEQNTDTNNFITVDGDTFKTSANENLVVK